MWWTGRQQGRQQGRRVGRKPPGLAAPSQLPSLFPSLLPSPACPAGDALCLHLKAAGEVVGYTPNLRAAAASYLVEHGNIRVDAVTGVCTCTTLADLLKPVIFRPQDGCCTCHGHMLHGTCCHLLAAAQLPEFAGVELLTGGLHMEGGDGEQVRKIMHAIRASEYGAWAGQTGRRAGSQAHNS